MSETGFTPIHKLLKSGSSTGEIVDRIDRGELYWLDDFGRHMLAGDIEKESVIESLRAHFKIENNPSAYEGDQITEYWNQWSVLDTPIMAPHTLVRGGFLDAGPAELSKPLATIDRNHVSNKLAILNQAATRFWANVDPKDRTTHESNATVVAWLIDKGYSESLAEKGATIIRPEWAPTGRKPEE